MSQELIERDIDAYLEAHEQSAGETVFPPRAPFFALANAHACERSGESAVSPPRESGQASTDAEGQKP